MAAHPDDTGYTPEELATLAQYEGGGGLHEAGASADAALNEFYTPPEIINKVWELLDAYAPQAKTVLEPSGGTGRFAAGRTGNEFTIQELNPVSARICKILHPDATVRVGAYQSNFFDDTGRVHLAANPDEGQYDLSVGNTPYGANSGEWRGRGEGREFDRVEEYFASRGLDSLKTNGLLAYVMPSGFLRTLPDRAKEIIAQKGELLDAWRLPNGAFPTTDVGTDIVILRKTEPLREIAEQVVQRVEKQGASARVNIEGGQNHAERVETVASSLLAERLNRLSNDFYFTKLYPNHVLGVQETRIGQHGEEQYVRLADGDADMAAALSRIAPDPGAMRQMAAAAPKAQTALASTPRKGDAPRRVRVGGRGSATEAQDVPTHTTEAFARKYGKEYSPELQEIWRSSDYEGVVDERGVSPAARDFLHASDDYLMVAPGRWQHRMLYATGDIYAKLERLDAQQSGDAPLPPEAAATNRQALLAALPELRPMEKITFQPDAVLAEEFTVEHFNAAANATETLPLKEAFLRWATGCDLPGNGTGDYRSNRENWIGNFSLTPISQDEIPEACSWRDIYDFVKGSPVRAAIGRTDEEKAVNAMEAAKRRDARMEAATRLFNRFLQEGLSPEQKTALCKEWNRRFNAIRQADYSALPLFVDGMAEDYKGQTFTLNDQQVRGIGFLCQSGNGLLAYDVGVGKTAAGIVTTINQIQTGRAKRPIIVVPKSVYSKWVSDLREMFPGVTVNDLGNFSDANLAPFRNPKDAHALRIPEGSVSVCTIEALQKISVTDESIHGALFEDFKDVMGSDVDERKDGSAARANEVQKIKEEIGEGTKAKPGFVFWEKCGFDCITVDEAHRFKNLFMQPRAKTKGGSNEYAALGTGNPSARAKKLFALTSLVQRANHGRGVFLLTATPFTNSPMEVYSMLSYMARTRLQAMGLKNLRDFVAEYAELKSEWSVNSKGGIQMKQVMKSFQQLNSLQNFLTQYIDKVDGEEAGVIRPRKRTHKVMLTMTDTQRQIVDAEIRRMVNPDSAKNGGVLVAMNNMRMAMLSPALIAANADDYYKNIDLPPITELVESSPKLKMVCDTVVDAWKTHQDAGQVIYMPRGVEHYSQVAAYLVSKGVPESAIGFIDSNVAANKKDQIVEKFNDKNDKLKILIGSETISEGVDLNRNSIAIYNTMLGWNPTESVQVEGRIWRQGNKQGHVHVVYPLIADSIDSLLMQKHDEKSSRINAIWSYKGDKLNVSDIDPEELKFDLIRDPVVRAKFNIDQRKAEFDGERTIIGKKIEDLTDIQDTLKQQRDRIEYLESEKKEEEEALAALKGKPAWNTPYTKERIKEYANFIAQAKRTIATLEGKLARQGIDGEAGIPAAIEKLQKRDAALENEIENVNKSFAAIVAAETEKLMRDHEALKPLEIAQAELSDAILGDLRPMKEVKVEIEAERAARNNANGVAQTPPPAKEPAPEAVQPGTITMPGGDVYDPEKAKTAAVASAMESFIATAKPLPMTGNGRAEMAAAKASWQDATSAVNEWLNLAPGAYRNFDKDRRAPEMLAVMQTIKQPDIVYEEDRIEGLFAVDTHHTYIKTFRTDGMANHDPERPYMVVQIETGEPFQNPGPGPRPAWQANVTAKGIKISYAAENALENRLQAAMTTPEKILYLDEQHAQRMGIDPALRPGREFAQGQASAQTAAKSRAADAAMNRLFGPAKKPQPAPSQGRGASLTL